MKIFIVGDYWSGMGPANATKNMIQAMPAGTLHLRFHTKILRAIEIITKMFFADTVVFSGFSVQVLFGLHIAHLLGKKTFYWMHGSIWFESEINRKPAPVMVKKEQEILEQIDYILAVSDPFCIWLKNRYPVLQHKIKVLTNGINWEFMNIPSASEKKMAQILSSGGGLPIKNIVTICYAVSRLREKYSDMEIRLVVVGEDGEDTEEIKKYAFVDYQGKKPHEDVLKLMQESELYIQNSIFDTFGLAPIEALLCGCNVLLSGAVGAGSIISSLEQEDIIINPADTEELLIKIEQQMQCGNNNRLLAGIDHEAVSVEQRAGELIELARSLN